VNLYGFVDNDGFNRGDLLGLARISVGAYEASWDLDLNKEYEVWPGGLKSKPTGDAWAIALIRCRVDPQCCEIKSGISTAWELEEIELEIYGKVHLLAGLLNFGSKLPTGETVTPDMNIFAYNCELDHVDDFAAFAQEPQTLLSLKTIESSLKRSTYSSHCQCIQASKDRVLSDPLLSNRAQDAISKTRTRLDRPRQNIWDGRTPHQYPAPEWMNDPRYDFWKR
jgi:hypothetical protein